MILKSTVQESTGKRDLLIDPETWATFLEPALRNDSAAAEFLARLLLTLKDAIESGSDGARQASDTLLVAIELTYLYTDAHAAALKLYLLSLTGHVKPENEPLNLINKSIKNAMAEVECERKRRAQKGKRRAAV